MAAVSAETGAGDAEGGAFGVGVAQAEKRSGVQSSAGKKGGFMVGRRAGWGGGRRLANGNLRPRSHPAQKMRRVRQRLRREEGRFGVC